MVLRLLFSISAALNQNNRDITSIIKTYSFLMVVPRLVGQKVNQPNLGLEAYFMLFSISCRIDVNSIIQERSSSSNLFVLDSLSTGCNRFSVMGYNYRDSYNSTIQLCTKHFSYFDTFLQQIMESNLSWYHIYQVMNSKSAWLNF